MSMILLAFRISHYLNIKGHVGSDKTLLSKCTILIKKSYVMIAYHVHLLNHDLYKSNWKKNKTLKDKIYLLTTDYHSSQKVLYHPLQMKTQT